jgi:hypothetical protein
MEQTMDEEVEAALMRAGQQIDWLQRENEVLRAERDHARATVDNAVKLLTGIHSLLYPAPITTADGRTMVFRPSDPSPHEVLQRLSDRIRALPDALADLQKPNVI